MMTRSYVVETWDHAAQAWRIEGDWSSPLTLRDANAQAAFLHTRHSLRTRVLNLFAGRVVATYGGKVATAR